jgi:23S rRNA (pseudouridine1915-N3)-methyltransferase
MKLRVLWPGKTKKSYYRQAIDDYASRIRKLLPFEIVETKEESTTDRKRTVRVKKESSNLQNKRKAPVCVILDSTGIQMSSVDFSRWLQQQNTDVDFLLGGPEGHNVSGQSLKLSFGKMTLPHELARVVLLEQIYRAATILKRIPYHK